MRRLTPILLTYLVCSAAPFAGENIAAEKHGAIAGTSTHTKLAAADAKSKIPQNALFEQLIGTWDVQYEFVDKAGKARINRGQVNYSWILDGKALQEVWTSDSEGKDARPFGTMINFYDIKRQHWTAVWVYPAEGMTTIMTGGEVGGSFVLTGHDEAGALQRWSTSIVKPDSGLGTFDISNDEGKTWRQVGVNHMQRRRG
jgi:hypothetical protein